MRFVVTIEIDDKELDRLKNSLSNDTKILGSHKILDKYVKMFNGSNSFCWTNDSIYNLVFLQYTQRIANDMLRTKKKLYLNEVLKMLGMSETDEGQCVGWIYDEKNPIDDNYVDFGINDEVNIDFMYGRTADALLDFNVDGCILNR